MQQRENEAGSAAKCSPVPALMNQDLDEVVPLMGVLMTRRAVLLEFVHPTFRITARDSWLTLVQACSRLRACGV